MVKTFFAAHHFENSTHRNVKKRVLCFLAQLIPQAHDQVAVLLVFVVGGIGAVILEAAIPRVGCITCRMLYQ